jgi:hypothetical protein
MTVAPAAPFRFLDLIAENMNEVGKSAAKLSSQNAACNSEISTALHATLTSILSVAAPTIVKKTTDQRSSLES